MERDMLQMAIEAIRYDPTLLGDEARLARVLGLRRPASARFWKIKAREVLHASGYVFEDSNGSAQVGDESGEVG